METMSEDGETKADDVDLNPFASFSSSSKTRPGIVYLSTVPAKMNVTQIRQFFSDFGEIGRIYLARDKNASQHKYKKNPIYREGWIEFLDKKIAKAVARDLNCTPVGKKKHPELWNIKYLSRFTWINLNERQEIERQLKKQKHLFGVEYAKKITSNFVQNLNSGMKRQSIPAKEFGVKERPVFQKQNIVKESKKSHPSEKGTNDEFLQHLM